MDFEAQSKGIETDLSRDASVCRQVVCSCSVFLWLAAVVVFVLQTDFLAAIVLIPPWCWALAGIVMAVVGWDRAYPKSSVWAIVLWILFAIIFIDESQGLRRASKRIFFAQERMTNEDAALRFVTLNCAGRVQAAEEMISVEPDVLLLQEAPGHDHVAELTNYLFGSAGRFLHKGDTAIIADGEIFDVTPLDASHFAHARLQFPDGRELNVVSLRLTPPVFRMDFWTSGFWNDHRDRRALHRWEIASLISHLRLTASTGSLVVGGDFNTTPNDIVLNQMREKLSDTFGAAGSGWGNTGTNDYPLFRVDQIWASFDVEVVRSRAHKTEHSDHRVVVSDLLIPAF